MNTYEVIHPFDLDGVRYLPGEIVDFRIDVVAALYVLGFVTAIKLVVWLSEIWLAGQPPFSAAGCCARPAGYSRVQKCPGTGCGQQMLE